MGIPSHDPALAKAIQQIDRIKSALAAVGIRFRELGRDVFGVGLGITSDNSDFLVLSISGPADGVLNITAGILKNVSHERHRLLELCNTLNRDNASCPVYLHDAPDGWDIHVQQRHLISLLEAAPWFLCVCIENLLAVTQAIRSKLQEAGVGGQPYQWNTPDTQRLLTRSLV